VRELDSDEFSMYGEDRWGMTFTVGSLPDGITSLQRLRHLRLEECVTATLTRSIERLTQLTSLEILSDQLIIQDIYRPRPVAVRQLHATHTLCILSRQCIAADAHCMFDAAAPCWALATGGSMTCVRPVTRGRFEWLTHQPAAQALPTSLRGLEAISVPVTVVALLTALERLSLHEMCGCTQTTPSLSALQRLTQLRLKRAGNVQLQAITSCTGLRSLRLYGMVFSNLCAAWLFTILRTAMDDTHVHLLKAQKDNSAHCNLLQLPRPPRCCRCHILVSPSCSCTAPNSTQGHCDVRLKDTAIGSPRSAGSSESSQAG
jgi:hypothetical protein